MLFEAPERGEIRNRRARGFAGDYRPESEKADSVNFGPLSGLCPEDADRRGRSAPVARRARGAVKTLPPPRGAGRIRDGTRMGGGCEKDCGGGPRGDCPNSPGRPLENFFSPPRG